LGPIGLQRPLIKFEGDEIKYQAVKTLAIREDEIRSFEQIRRV
jgi:hypothetical protein